MRRNIIFILFTIYFILFLNCSNKNSTSPELNNPILYVSPELLNFDTDKSNMELVIKNNGKSILEWSINANREWISSNQDIGTGDTVVTIKIDRSYFDSIGTYSGELIIDSNGGNKTIKINAIRPNYDGLWYAKKTDVQGSAFPFKIEGTKVIYQLVGGYIVSTNMNGNQFSCFVHTDWLHITLTSAYSGIAYWIINGVRDYNWIVRRQ